MRVLPVRWLGTPVRWALGVWPLLLACGILAYFGYHAVHGSRGLLAWVDRNREIEAARGELAELTARKQELQRRIDGLAEGRMDRDRLEEELRRLGYIRENERIILTPRDVDPRGPGDN